MGDIFKYIIIFIIIVLIVLVGGLVLFYFFGGGMEISFGIKGILNIILLPITMPFNWLKKKFGWGIGFSSKFVTQVPMDAHMNIISEAENIEKMLLAEEKRYETMGLERLHEQQKRSLDEFEAKRALARKDIPDNYSDKMQKADETAKLALQQLNQKYENDTKYAGEEMKLAYDQMMRRIAKQRYVRGLPWPSVETEKQRSEIDAFAENGKKQYALMYENYQKNMKELLDTYTREYEAISKLAQTEKRGTAPVPDNIGGPVSIKG